TLDAAIFEKRERVARDGAVVAAVEGEATRVGDPIDVVLGSQPIEVNFGESAAIVIARAEEENLLLHLLVDVDVRRRNSWADTCGARSLPFIVTKSTGRE